MTLRPASSAPAAPPRPPSSPAPGKAAPPAARAHRPPAGADAAPPTPFRRCLAALSEVRPLERRAPPADAERPFGLAAAGRPEPSPPRFEPPLEPFRVPPAFLGGPERPLPAAGPLDEAMRMAGELVESMRVGRLGSGAHVVALRLRRSDGTLGVQLVDEGGRLRLRLTEEADGFGDRVCEALRAVGVEVELEVG